MIGIDAFNTLKLLNQRK
jgi:hypothetical protein